MKIVSWNVNGIRSVFNKGFLEWFNRESPEIICLQEIKADLEQFPTKLSTLTDYQLQVHSAQKKGYSGVATFSRNNFLDTKKLGVKKFDEEGRTLIHEFSDFFLLNCYFPNGQRDHSRVEYKLQYYKKMLETLNQLKKKKPVLIVGDFNTAHQEIDLANPKENEMTSGFLKRERKWIDTYIQNELIDGFRHFHPLKKQDYTWWTYRHHCRERNIGWRIDYAFFTPELLPRIKNVTHLHHVLGSDHCPVLIEFK